MTEDHEHEAEPLEQDITSTADDLDLENGPQESEGEAEFASSRQTEEARTEDEDEFEDDEDELEDEEEEEEEGEEEDEEEPESAVRPRPSPKLERLQKILAQAGIASRRHAEELITEGRVQVNGKVVTILGSKADPTHDHIRVDGKLLHGAERLRYFMLNKPRGYVTTVTDPEGRPTVMEFFAKMGERLYPVGRLDYQSEGLLLVTNDGELANSLTKAASGVEKTYLVKVSGRPDEEQLEALRGGVSIERGKPGEGKVRTAPARIRPIRQGDNPWFEVVLIEGRNRELRKMFEEIGHRVEKIRRVGYGPLVLDLEPGKLRELDLEEVAALRLAAEGKLKPRRLKTSGMLPREAGRSAEGRERGFRPGSRGAKPGSPPTSFRPRGERPLKQDDRRRQNTRGAEDRGGARREGFVPRQPNRETERSQGRPFRREPGFDRPHGERPGRPSGGFAARSGGQRPYRSGPPSEKTPRFERPGRSSRETERSQGRPRREPGLDGPHGERPGPPSGGFAARSGGQRPYRSGPPSEKMPRFERPGPSSREDERSQGRPFRREPGFDRPHGERPGPPSGRFAARPGGQRPYRSGPPSEKMPRFERPGPSDRPRRGEGNFRGEETRKAFRPQGERRPFDRVERGPRDGKRAESAGRGFKRGPGQSSSRNFERPVARDGEPQRRQEGGARARRGESRGVPEEQQRPFKPGRNKPAYGSKSPRSGERAGGYSRPKSGHTGKPPGGGKRGGGKRPGGPTGGRRRG